MATTLSVFDPAKHLDNEKVITEYLNVALKDEDPDAFLTALGNVAKARGMAEVAQAAGVGRESLYKALSPGSKPRFDTISRVCHALGVQLHV